MNHPGRGFEWIDASWGPVLTCTALSTIAVHGWTTRALALELSDEQCARQWTSLTAHADLTLSDLSRLTQVHGRDIVPIDRPHTAAPHADGQSTGSPGVLLAIRVADCVPLLAADRRTGAVAAIHAGWRGTAAGIAREAIAHLHSHYGTAPSDVVAAIGPSIGPCSYIVGEEVRDAFRASGWSGVQLQSWFANAESASTPPPSRSDLGARFGAAAPELAASTPTRQAAAGNSQVPTSNFTLDLWRANRDQLVEAGVPGQSVYVSELCTACDADRFYSYRRDGKGTGRLVGFIARRP